MQRKKLASKIASILLSAAMLVSTSMTALATEGDVQVAAEQTVSETTKEAAHAESGDIAVVSEDTEAATEGEITEEATEEAAAVEEEITLEDIQEDVEAAQVLDAEETAVEENEPVLADDISAQPKGKGTPLKDAPSISFYYEESEKTLYFFKCEGEDAALPDNKESGSTSQWYQADKEGKIKQVEKVVIGEGITGVGAFNFSNKHGDYPNLKTVELAATVTTIGADAFQQDASLTTINLNHVTSIGNEGFQGTAIETVTLDQSVVMGSSAFSGCTSLKTVTVQGISEWGEDGQAFKECTKLQSFKCTEEVNEIPNSTFSGCTSLTSCEVKGVQTVGGSAFWNCSSLTTFDFSKITTLSGNAFYGAGLTKIAFGNKSITVKTNALKCSSLTSICYPGTNEEWTATITAYKGNVPGNPAVHCKADTVEAKEATCTENGWREAGVCEVCGEHYSYPTDEYKISAEGHKYSETYTVDKAASCTTAGSESKHCKRCDAMDPDSVKEIPAAGHKYGTWTTTTKATVFAPAVQTRTCSVCKNKETRENGSKLTPTIKVSAETVLLKTSQKTSAFKVTGLANGDSVKSYQSGNTKLFTVDKKGVITATKKTGTAKLTITLASGLKKTVTVKVQKKAVATTKITGLTTKVTVKKGAKLTLKPSRVPVTSTQAFSYTSSNKKVATVSSKGVITAKAAGTAKITVKSGSKKVVVTVTVPKTKTTAITVKTSVTVKKGKTVALNAKKTPTNSDEKITYTSANKKIATVTSAGKIKGVKKGTTTITVKSGSITKKVKVTVK